VIDGQMAALPPQATHTHQQCQPPEVTFHWPGTQEKWTVHPNHGDPTPSYGGRLETSGQSRDEPPGEVHPPDVWCLRHGQFQMFTRPCWGLARRLKASHRRSRAIGPSNGAAPHGT
jgi:hypothetical protein